MDSIKDTYIDPKCIGLNRFLLCFLINNIGLFFLMMILPAVIVKVLFLIPTLAVYFWYLIKYSSFKNIEDLYLKIVFVAYALWTLYIMRNGVFFDYEGLTTYLFTPHSFLVYTIPFILLLPLTNENFIYYIFYYSKRLGPFFFVFLLLHFIVGDIIAQSHGTAYIEYLAWVFIGGSGLILLTSYFHSTKTIIIAFVIILISLLLVTYYARRNSMVTCLGYLFTAAFIYLYYNKEAPIIKKITYTIFLTIALLASIFGLLGSGSNMFSAISNRATENTREDAFMLYFVDMSENPDNWKYGKGLHGDYYAPSSYFSEAEVDPGARSSEYRMLIECGYLQMLLNGGGIYLALFLAILLPAFVKGLFFSKNVFVKACAFLILLWLIDMAPFGLPIFMFRYFLVWFSVGICFSKKIRNLSNEDIARYISDKEASLNESSCSE